MEQFISLQRQLLVAKNMFLENDESLINMLNNDDQTEKLFTSIGLMDKENVESKMLQHKLKEFRGAKEM